MLSNHRLVATLQVTNLSCELCILESDLQHPQRSCLIASVAINTGEGSDQVKELLGAMVFSAEGLLQAIALHNRL